MIDLVAELEGMLVAWRARRSSELAELIEELSTWFTPVMPEFGSGAWFTREAARSPFELPLLLATVDTDNITRAILQLDTLLRWPQDPRTSTLLRRLLVDTPFRPQRNDFWFAVIRLLRWHADPRMLPLIKPERIRHMWRSGSKGRSMQQVCAAAALDLEQKAVIEDGRYAERAARLAAELESGRALRDAVVAGDLLSRAVYLDWLMERGFTPASSMASDP